MPDPNRTVFISYRRSVASFIARAVFNDLRAHGFDVFMDVESINSGEFERIIPAQIAARAHFLPILTPGTLERCSEPGDWVRREIELAIDLERNIVPLLIGDFSFEGAAPFLTGKLARLRAFNGLPVPHEYFDAAMERLRTRFLQRPVDLEITPPPEAHEETVRRMIERVASAPAPDPAQLAAEAIYERAFEKQAAGDLAGAIADYSEAIRMNPAFAAAYNNRGNAYFTQGDLERALADYNRSIELDNPELHLPYNNRGNIHYQRGDLESALADYTEAIRLNPQYAGAYYNRGNVLTDQGELEAAVADYDTAIRLDPQYSEAYNSRGIAHAQLGNLEQAEADCTRSIETNNPVPCLPYLNRAYIRAARGNRAGAVADFRQFLALGGGETYGNRAEIEQEIAELEKEQAGKG